MLLRSCLLLVTVLITVAVVLLVLRHPRASAVFLRLKSVHESKIDTNLASFPAHPKIPA